MVADADTANLLAAWMELNRKLAAVQGPARLIYPDDGPPDDPGFGWVGGQWADAPRAADAVTVVIRGTKTL